MITTGINYAVYEDETEFLGITEATLPSVEWMDQTITGSHIQGELTIPIIAQLKSMELTLKHSATNPFATSLVEPRMHNIELREVQQNFENGELTPTKVKHVFKVFPKSLSGATLKPQSTSDPSNTFSVYYWKQERDGEEEMELDPINSICKINGKDYMEEIRTFME